MMPHRQRSQDSKPKEDHPRDSGAQVPMHVQDHKNEEKAVVTVSSAPSSSDASTGITARGEPGPVTPSSPQKSEGVCSPPSMSMASSEPGPVAPSSPQKSESICSSPSMSMASSEPGPVTPSSPQKYEGVASPSSTFMVSSKSQPMTPRSPQNAVVVYSSPSMSMVSSEPQPVTPSSPQNSEGICSPPFMSMISSEPWPVTPSSPQSSEGICSPSMSMASSELGPATPSISQKSEGISLPPPMSVASSQSSQSSEGSSKQEQQGSRPSQKRNIPQVLRGMLLNVKLNHLVLLLFCKYQRKEQVTMEEMLRIVDKNYREQFLLTFREFCECMCVGLGINMMEVNPPGRIYELVPVTGLTYKGITADGSGQLIAKLDLFLLILSVIFIKGNRVSEKDLRKQVKRWETLVQMEEIVIDDPWAFVREDLVREEYLVYEQAPNSNPAHYEFQWGPRAHAETTQMKILEHVAKLNKMDPSSYSHLYTKALQEEKDSSGASEGQDA